MANPEHLEILKQGVKQWNRWREEQPDVYPDLRVASLSGASLARRTSAGRTSTEPTLPGQTSGMQSFAGQTWRRQILGWRYLREC